MNLRFFLLLFFFSLPFCFASDDSINQTMPINDTNTTTTTNSTEPPLLEYCSPTLEIDSNKEFYNNSEKIRIYNRLTPKNFDFMLEYWVEDLFGNIVKDPYITTNTNSKQFTPKIEEQDRILILKNRLLFINCIINNTPESNISILNQTNQKFVFISNPHSTASNPNSSININKVYLNKDNTISFGEILQVSINAYRGDTRKYAVKAWVYDYKGWKVSEVTTTHLKSKFTNYTLTLPISLKSDCTNRYGAGIYTLVVEGLNITKTASISIRGKSKLCKTITKEVEIPPKETTTSRPKFVFNLSVPRTIGNNAEYSFYIENNHDEQHNFSLSSYVFNGNKKYSDIKNKTVSLPPNSATSVDFALNHSASSGIHKIMVKAVVDDQSTIRSFSEEVVVFNAGEETARLEELFKQSYLNQALNSSKENRLTAYTVYESTSEISKNLIPYAIMLSLLFLVLVLLVKKK